MRFWRIATIAPMLVVCMVFRRQPIACLRRTTRCATRMLSTTLRRTIRLSTTLWFRAIWFGLSRSISPRCLALGVLRLFRHMVGTMAGTIRSTIGTHLTTATVGIIRTIGAGTIHTIGVGDIHIRTTRIDLLITDLRIIHRMACLRTMVAWVIPDTTTTVQVQS